MTYTPWVTTILQLTSPAKVNGSYIDKCKSPEPVLANITQCSKHIPPTATAHSFVDLVKKVIADKAHSDPALLYVRIGSVAEGGLSADPSGKDIVSLVDAVAVQSAWSWRVYANGNESVVKSTKEEISKAWATTPHAKDTNRF